MADEALSPPRTIAATCRFCGCAFAYNATGAGRPRSFCSAVCRSAGKQRRISVASCRTCGRTYQPRYDGAGFCSVACRRLPDRRIWPSEQDRSAHNSHRRRAQKRGRPHEKFSRLEIYERDGWMCGICGKRVSPSARYPAPSSASLDHILPLAAGGAHTRSNVQCAHLLCNSLKQDRGGGQFNLGI